MLALLLADEFMAIDRKRAPTTANKIASGDACL
jgi:hypothetical protein